MNQFKEWGFSTQWWRGEKGEYWVLGQTVLSVGFVLLPVYPAIAQDHFSPIWKYADWGLTGIFGLIALLLLFSGSLRSGQCSFYCFSISKREKKNHGLVINSLTMLPTSYKLRN